MLLILRLKMRPLSLTIEEIVDGFFNEVSPRVWGLTANLPTRTNNPNVFPMQAGMVRLLDPG